MYDFLFVRPTLWLAALASRFDTRWIDGFLHALVSATKWVAQCWDRIMDRGVVDGTVNKLADATYDAGVSLRNVQTGRLRQYVLFIAIGTWRYLWWPVSFGDTRLRAKSAGYERLDVQRTGNTDR